MTLDYQPPPTPGIRRLIPLFLALAGTLHFSISLALLSTFLQHRDRTGHTRWNLPPAALPALILFTLFLAASLLAIPRRKLAIALISAALILSAADFLYDASTRNYQTFEFQLYKDKAPAHEKNFEYFTWWWYDEYWIYGPRGIK